MAVPMASPAKRVTFGGFQRCIASFRVAGVSICDIPTCFIMCRKSFCAAGAILLPCFQRMRCIFHGRHNTLETSIVILRGRRSTLEESCCVFLRIALSGLPQVVTACKFCGRRGIFEMC